MTDAFYPLNDLFLLVFSTDDRVTSASTVTEKTNKNISSSYHTNAQSKHEHHHPSSSTTHPQPRPEVDFLSKNIERIRMTSLRNKYVAFFNQ